MVVSARSDREGSRAPMSAAGQEVIWHDLECGSYSADLALWRELAGRCAGPVLDIGAGTGRVALDLARAGHSVTALELDPVLFAALEERAAEVEVEPVCADARSFDLKRRDFALCLVPMQTIQLLGGRAQRMAFLARAHAHLRPGGLIACAILSTLEPFDCALGDVAPAPESVRVQETLYLSRPTRVAVLRSSVLIERERLILACGLGTASAGRTGAREGGERARLRDVIELDRVSATLLESEAAQAGLSPEPAREVVPTEDHVGSVVVMLRG